MTETIQKAVHAVWRYHQLSHKLAPADIIWVLGSRDLRVADRAAELWLRKLAPIIVMSGGFGNFTEGVFDKSEAELLTERAIEIGLPDGYILIENQSTNTGENVTFTRELLKDKNMAVSSVIAVQKPYMERRTYATIRAQWPQVSVQVTSPQLSFSNYCTDQIPEKKVISIMVGDLQRIIEYPKLGFMIEQDVPNEITEAMQILIHAGYDSHLIG